MSREIKFRAWTGEEYEYFPCGEYFGTFDYIIEQYTGLKDKNGVEIYEGDVVEYDSKYKVEYNNASAMFELEDIFDHNEVTTFDCLPLNSCEIIGNIHEGV